jgi:hypothetical protein
VEESSESKKENGNKGPEGEEKKKSWGDAACALERVQEGNNAPRVTKSRGSGYLAPLIVAACRGDGCSALGTVGGGVVRCQRPDRLSSVSGSHRSARRHLRRS